MTIFITAIVSLLLGAALGALMTLQTLPKSYRQQLDTYDEVQK